MQFTSFLVCSLLLASQFFPFSSFKVVFTQNHVDFKLFVTLKNISRIKIEILLLFKPTEFVKIRIAYQIVPFYVMIFISRGETGGMPLEDATKV